MPCLLLALLLRFALIFTVSSPILIHESLKRLKRDWQNGARGARGFVLAAAGLAVIEGPEVVSLVELICFSGVNTTIIVENAVEASILLSRISKSCSSSPASINVINQLTKRTNNKSLEEQKMNHTEQLYHYRAFKLNSLALACPYRETIYIDNDVTFRNDTTTDIFFNRGFSAFDTKSDLSVGVAVATMCLRHSIEDLGVPDSFCQRQGGVLFLRCDRNASNIMNDWNKTYHRYIDRDKHDQLSLRLILYRRQHELLNLPPALNCRHPCKDKYRDDCLLYHAHLTKDRRTELDCFYSSSISH
uniref:Nucleotide-diphospho-sugar transferase domain-containing protein n=1 Tax=Aureoumbra lagunensis TaxID=44058 RepID=A0A7S3JYC2_9STRA|mmetsp:Transcript_1727/g.2636  ORF Transcript_1727/g.2636 Transcript_1727/m.2636 type:complete len:303 (-) Transcript_1727:373-1281(-)